MKSDAIISKCEKYRYSLLRVWDDDKPKMMFIMLNPSTADASNDDPTIRRCIGYAKEWGFGGIIVCNLFAIRSTSPALMKEFDNPIGYDNDRYLLMLAENIDFIVCAWGNHGSFMNRSKDVIELLKKNNYDLCCLEMSNAGEPKHPLYLKKDLIPFVME